MLTQPARQYCPGRVGVRRAKCDALAAVAALRTAQPATDLQTFGLESY